MTRSEAAKYRWIKHRFEKAKKQRESGEITSSTYQLIIEQCTKELNALEEAYKQADINEMLDKIFKQLKSIQKTYESYGYTDPLVLGIKGNQLALCNHELHERRTND